MDQHTNLLTDDVPTVLECLFFNYGKATFEEGTQKKYEVMNVTWLPSNLLMLLVAPLY